MNRSRSTLLVSGWLLVVLVLLLAPSPREWGFFGKRFSNLYDDYRFVLQPTVHVVLMMFGAYLVTRLLDRWPPLPALLCGIGLTLLIAAAFECMQLFLPAGFARQCDALDLLPSFFGAVAGGAFALFRRSRRSA